MLNLGPMDLQTILAQLDQAIRHHEEWFQSLNRTLVCRLDPDPSDLEADAHHRCPFGNWYFNYANPRVREHPAFHAIGADHDAMHRSASALLRQMQSGEAVVATDYDTFGEALQRLRLQILTLRHELRDALHNLDPLTGTHSRIRMLTRLREQHEQVRRHAHDCSLAMLDLDDLRKTNESYGHQVGDRLLTLAARRTIENTRPYDLVYRYGGDEFLVCMQNCDLDQAQRILERLRLDLGRSAVETGREQPLYPHVSMGLTLMSRDLTVEEAIGRASRAVGAAKRAGGNLVRVWDPAMG